MRTKDPTDAASTRRALVWVPPPAPTAADLFAGGERRARWIRYWIRGKLHGAWSLTAHQAMKALPVEFGSDCGALLYREIGKRSPLTTQRMRDNLRALRPGLTEAQAARLTTAAWENRGRLMAEFATLPRMLPQGRCSFIGGARAQAAARAGPVLILALHLGNWELLSPAMVRLGIPSSTLYMPPEIEAQHRIALAVRKRLGVVVHPPGAKGVRPALRALHAGGTLGIFGDEGLDGRIMGPLFGRPPHAEGNLAIAVRLARHTGAMIIPTFVARRAQVRFDIHWLEPIALPPTAQPARRLLEDVALLNSVIEPIVRERLEQWYFLDHRL